MARSAALRMRRALLLITALSTQHAAGAPSCTIASVSTSHVFAGIEKIPLAQEGALRDLIATSGSPKLQQITTATALCCASGATGGTIGGAGGTCRPGKGEVVAISGGVLSRPFHFHVTQELNVCELSLLRCCLTNTARGMMQGRHGGNNEHDFIFCSSETGDIEEVQLEYARLGESVLLLRPPVLSSRPSLLLALEA